MQELKPFRVFLEVADQSSFVGAARHLRMTPASVTRIIARLEEDLGQQLFVRTTRQVSLTRFGAMVAARYRPVLQAFDTVSEEIVRVTRPDWGHLSINAPLSMGVRLLPDLIDKFTLAYPNISIDIRLTDQFIDIIEEDVDLAIRISEPPSDKSTIWQKICEVPRHAITSPRIFDRIERPVVPTDLDPHYCLSYGAGPETWRFRKGQAQHQVQAGERIVSNNGDVLYGLATSGTGIVVLPDFISAPGLSSGAVETVLPDWTVPSLWLTLFYPPYDALPPLVATFSAFFEAYVRDVDGLHFPDFASG